MSTAIRIYPFIAIGVFAFALLLAPRWQNRTAAQEPPSAQTETGTQSPFDHTALGVVLRANCNEVPTSGEDFIRVLNQVGDFAQLPVPFSSVSMNSGLANPRVILAPRTKVEAQTDGGEAMVLPKAPHLRPSPTPIPPRPLSTAELDQPNLEGRLFFAANMEKVDGNRIRAGNIEFISWNSRKKRFDFGVIDYAGAVPEIKFLDGVRCFSCHKSKGPILGSGPWSNTTNNEVVREAAAIALDLRKQSKLALSWNSRRVPGPEEKNPLSALKSQTTFDGFSLVLAEPESVDAAVRIGSDLVRDRAIYRAMLKSADGRKAFGYLLAAIVDPQPIDKSYQQVKQSLDLVFANNSPAFGNDVVAIQSAISSTLHDYSPAGSMGTIRTTAGKTAAWGRGSALPANLTISWSSTAEKVIAYNARRIDGEPAMASAKQPSNSKAFIHTSGGVPPRPSAAVSAAALARAIGLTEADRAFFAQTLANTAQRINKPKITAATLAQEVFVGPSFIDNWKTGDIPDREEFKDRFVSGLTAVAGNYQLASAVRVDRRDYASGPSFITEPGKEDREPEIIPTTACLRCHDVRGAGKPAFNPIPLLTFDPFDKKSRENWVRNADAKQKQAVLERFQKRLVNDMDMPPDDSLEHEIFRKQDRASFDSVQEFLESELKKLQKN